MMFSVSQVLNHNKHRPWPLPETPWLMTQTWKSLLFAHWPIEVEQMKQFIPMGLELDLWDGQAWLGIVPFEMSYQLRFCPWPIEFGELNVRTYVSCEGKPGVLFLSLDASDLFTVYMARLIYSLPYFSSAITVEKQGAAINYVANRPDSKGIFKGHYYPISEPFESQLGSFEHWLTERYCLYSSNHAGDLFRGNIHHSPWPLQHAKAEITQNTMAKVHHIHLPSIAPVLHYAENIEVVVWPLEKVKGSTS
jgi:uncharacterized protein